MKKSKNLKGFTLVEEVVSLFILSILILVASGMMISAMRVYSVNVKTQSAQNKGQYVYDLLSNKLTYSSGLQYETNGVFEPTNATYYKDREVKGVFDESEVYQEIAVDKNGITKGFKGETATERVEFAPYDVEVLLEAETTATSESVAPSASASADNSMNDEALFNLVSNLEVTDSAGYLTPQREVSFLGGLEIMNQSADVRNVATVGVDCTFYTKNSVNQIWGHPYIDISQLKGKVVRIKLFNLSGSDSIELFDVNGEVYRGKSNRYTTNDAEVEKEYVDKINNSDVNYLALYCDPEYVSFYDKDGKLLDANGNVVTGKTKTLKIDNSEADREITLWAGESVNYSLSSTLEGFNDVYVENSDPSVLSYIPKKNEDGTYTLNVIAGTPDSDTVVTLTVYDRYYSVNDGNVIDEKGVPIRINIKIKVPTVDTNSITVYKGGDSVKINTYDTPLDKLTIEKPYSTDISVEKRTDGIYVTGINKTSSPVILKLNYKFGNITLYEFEINVTVNEKSVAPSESPSEAPPASSSAVSSSKTTTGTTCTGESISKYRLRLTVTVKDKKGRKIYERSGSVSVMNYDNNDDKRYPTLSKINFKNTDNGGNGFKLRIYYVD